MFADVTEDSGRATKVELQRLKAVCNVSKIVEGLDTESRPPEGYFPGLFEKDGIEVELDASEMLAWPAENELLVLALNAGLEIHVEPEVRPKEDRSRFFTYFWLCQTRLLAMGHGWTEGR